MEACTSCKIETYACVFLFPIIITIIYLRLFYTIADHHIRCHYER